MARMPWTVLIVDDHHGFRAGARATLEADGFHVLGEAADGEAAVEAARRLQPQVVLLDVQLPGLAATGAAWLAGDVWSRLLYVHRGPLAQLALARSPLTAVAYVDGAIPSLARAPWPTLALCIAIVAAARGHRVATAAVAGALAL